MGLAKSLREGERQVYGHKGGFVEFSDEMRIREYVSSGRR
jgi:hypothetical protein